jgi:membrane protein
MTAAESHMNRLRHRFRCCFDWFRHYVGGIYHRADEHHIFLLSGGLAFSLFTCILPMVLIIFAVLGNLLSRPSIAAEITHFIDRVIPYEEYAREVRNLVFTGVDEFIIFKNVAGIIGIAGLVFAASGLFSGMRTVLNRIFQVLDDTSVFIGKMRDLLLILLVMIYFLLSTTILPGLDITQEFADKAGLLSKLRLDFLTEFVMQGFSLLLIFLSFLFIYFLIPQQRPPKKVIIVSALTASILWHVAQQVFGFYITNVVTLRRIYGAYFFLIATAFWIYYTSLVFILGAEIGQLYRERAEKHKSAINSKE